MILIKNEFVKIRRIKMKSTVQCKLSLVSVFSVLLLAFALSVPATGFGFEVDASPKIVSIDSDRAGDIRIFTDLVWEDNNNNTFEIYFNDNDYASVAGVSDSEDSLGNLILWFSLEDLVIWKKDCEAGDNFSKCEKSCLDAYRVCQQSCNDDQTCLDDCDGVYYDTCLTTCEETCDPCEDACDPSCEETCLEMGRNDEGDLFGNSVNVELSASGEMSYGTDEIGISIVVKELNKPNNPVEEVE